MTPFGFSIGHGLLHMNRSLARHFVQRCIQRFLFFEFVILTHSSKYLDYGFAAAVPFQILELMHRPCRAVPRHPLHRGRPQGFPYCR